MMFSVAKLHMRPDVLFAPADGNTYTWEDCKRAFSQQPFSKHTPPFRYLLPSPSSPLKPPILRYGWRIGRDKLMDIIRTHFNEAIRYITGPNLYGIDEGTEEGDAYIDSIPDEDWSKDTESSYYTFFDSNLFELIMERIGLRKDSKPIQRVLCIREFHDSEGNAMTGFAVGSNYDGVLIEPYYLRVKAIFAPNEGDAQWYLDEAAWRWRREPVKVKEKEVKNTEKGTTKTVSEAYTSETATHRS